MSSTSIQQTYAITDKAWAAFDNFIGTREEAIEAPEVKWYFYPSKTEPEEYKFLTKIDKLQRRASAGIFDRVHKSISDDLEEYYRSSEWGEPCRNMFKYLSANSPDLLVKIVRFGRLKPTLLTFAAEELGKINGSTASIAALVSLLRNEDSLVREGAVYGLSYRTEILLVRRVLQAQLLKEQSLGVREAIREALEEA